MDADERQFERIARYLDGEDVALNAQELALADEIRGDQALVGAGLEAGAEIPPAASERALRRMTAALAEPRKVRRTFQLVAAALAAAAILLAVSLAWPHKSTNSEGREFARWMISDVPGSDASDLHLMTAMTLDSETLHDLAEGTNPEMICLADPEGE